MVTSKTTPLIFVLISCLGYAQTISTRFPGKQSELISPNRQYILRDVDNSPEARHSILLVDRTTGSIRKVYEYTRHVGLIWTPDSSRFALNDYAGSDLTNTYIVATNEITPRIDVQQEISNKARGLSVGHHEYFGVARWLDNGRVVVHHWGHGDKNMFCRCYIYSLNGAVQTCPKQLRGSNPAQCQDMTP